MNRFALIVSVFILSLLLAVNLSAREELVDKIAAVVGDEIILVSELDFQMQMFMMQFQEQDLSRLEPDSLQNMILDQMVSDKLILLEARKDTTIQISDEQIEQALTQKIEELRSRFSTEAEFEAQMKLEGLTLRELKAKFRREVRNQLIKERFISRFLNRVSVTGTDVEEFYQNYKDSLPSQPEAVKLAHILLPIEPSGSTLDSAYQKALKVKQLLDEGGDFVALAQLYSEDATAKSGGDLGYFDKGTLFSEFEDVVFNLEKGDISEPFKTRLGYHIVKVEDKLPGRMHVRHILFKTNPSQSDDQVAHQLADSLRQLLLENKADFEELVKIYSIDDETKKQGGSLGWFAVSRLTPEFSKALGVIEVGEISEPTKSEYGYHVLKVLDYQESRPMTLENDWDRIKDFAKRTKSDQVMSEWLEEVKEKYYVDIRLDEN